MASFAGACGWGQGIVPVCCVWLVYVHHLHVSLFVAHHQCTAILVCCCCLYSVLLPLDVLHRVRQVKALNPTQRLPRERGGHSGFRRALGVAMATPSCHGRGRLLDYDRHGTFLLLPPPSLLPLGCVDTLFYKQRSSDPASVRTCTT